MKTGAGKHESQQSGIPHCARLSAPAKQRPSPELIAIILAILVPLAIFCWQLVNGQRTDPEAALALDPARQSPIASAPVEAVKPRPSPEKTAANVLPLAAMARSHLPREVASVVARGEATQPEPPKEETPPAVAPSAPVEPVNQPRQVKPLGGAPILVAVSPATPTQTPPNQKGPVAASAPGPVHSSPMLGRAVAPAAPLRTAGDVPTAVNVPTAGASRAGAVAPPVGVLSLEAATAAPSPASLVKPIAIVDDPEIERLLDEAWGLIERGDYEPGRSRLEKARKKNRDDPRANFSLGLLAGLIQGDWGDAEKRFSDCLRRDPENVPSLNNLAIALLHNTRNMEAAKRWKVIVEKRAATAEVVQNLGRARFLIKQGEIRKNTALLKLLDELYTEAAVATAQTSRPEAGFSLMALRLPDGRSVGWSNPRTKVIMVDISPLSKAKSDPNASAVPRPTWPHATVPSRGVPISGTLIPGPVAPGYVDPRIPASGRYQSGANGYGSQPQNVNVPSRSRRAGN